MFAPFLPFISEEVQQILGFDAPLAGQLEIKTYQEATRPHQALIYDHADAVGSWQPQDLPVGQALREPKPLVTKLKPELVDEERAKLGLGD